jgi:para-nitrobenzyl esterase
VTRAGRGFDRRQVLSGGLAFAMSFSGLRVSAADIGLRSAVVRTKLGAVRGSVGDNVITFKGIPYGASTGGHNRFLPPKRPDAWDGIREATHLGPFAITSRNTDHTANRVLRGAYADELRTGRDLDGMSENCLNLNVWTPELGTQERRPVMVWLHPGSFSYWTSYGEWTDGRNLARKRDVVVVSVTHRLGVLGFLYLGELAGPDFAESGNLGMLDIVAALKWIQENIREFGGDPDRVTVFGESGGGGKVSTLMAMPAAKGLFHGAIIQSSPMLRALTRQDATAETRRVLTKVGLNSVDIGRLRDMPAMKLLASDHASLPVVAGDALPRHPFDPDASPYAANVPLLLGYNENEAAYGLTMNDRYKPPTGTSEVVAGLAAELGFEGVNSSIAADILQEYLRAHSNVSLEKAYIGASTVVRWDDCFIAADRKCRQAASSVFMYLFSWKERGFGGKYGSSHTFEIPFVFDNLDAARQLFGGRPDELDYALASKMSKAWTAFAHSGRPGHTGLPQWPEYSVADRATMNFSEQVKLEFDPSRIDRVLMTKLRERRLVSLGHLRE